MLSDYFDAWSATPSVLAVYRAPDEIVGSKSNIINNNNDNNNDSTTSSSTRMKVEDRLLYAEKERINKLANKKQQVQETKMKECTGKPQIDSRSAALVERRPNTARNVVHRLSLYQKQKQQHQQQLQLQAQQQQQHQQIQGQQQQILYPENYFDISEEEKIRQQQEAEKEEKLLTKPKINKMSEKIEGRGVDAMMNWKSERDRKRRAAEDTRLLQEAQTTTGKPQLNPTSVAIARNRKIIDGTTDLDAVDDLLRRHYEHEMKMKQKFDEMYCQPHVPNQNDDPTTTASSVNNNFNTNNAAAAADPNAVTQRLCQDAESRRERREQKQLAAELMSYIDPVTGEVLFHPNQNRHNNNNNNSSCEGENDVVGDQSQSSHDSNNNEVEEDNNKINLKKQNYLRRSNNDPELWDRLSKNRGTSCSSSSRNPRSESRNNNTNNRNGHQLRAPSSSVSTGRKSLSLKRNDNNNNNNQQEQEECEEEYQLVEIEDEPNIDEEEFHNNNNNHRGGTARSRSRSRSYRDSSCESNYDNTNNNNNVTRARSPSISQYSKLLAEIHRGKTQEAGQENENIYNRLSKPRSISSQQDQEQQQGNNNNYTHQQEKSSSKTFKPIVDEKSKQLDPRRNERGMSRIEGLLQHQKEKQRELEYLQMEQKLKEEEELRTMQTMNPLNNRRQRHSVPLSREEREAFADRQTAWNARRKQKVSAKLVQQQESEVADCTFQPAIVGDDYYRPSPPRFSYFSTSSAPHDNNGNSNGDDHDIPTVGVNFAS